METSSLTKCFPADVQLEARGVAQLNGKREDLSATIPGPGIDENQKWAIVGKWWMLDQKIPQLYHNYHNYTTILDLEMSRENLASRSLDRPRELIVFFIAPFSRIEMLKRNVENKFSFSSRTTRKNLDIVKIKLEYIVYFNHQMMIKEKHTTFPNITTLISKEKPFMFI